MLVAYYEVDYNYAMSGNDKEFIYICRGEVEVDQYGSLHWTWEDPYMVNEDEPEFKATEDYCYCLTHWMPIPRPDIEDMKRETEAVKEEWDWL